ncbi:prolyl-tRNA synthetase [Neoconidiobolus thromboides FSU 785]|nr:prolyl-tRNA synthetase [Neoconidiobolus thromboides FSU 785]
MADYQKLTHSIVTNPTEWQTAISSSTEQPSSYQLSKTLVFKPKTGKNAAVQPIVFITIDTAQFNTNAVAKFLGFKEMRLASGDLLSEIFKADKDTISPFTIAKVDKDQISNVVVAIDQQFISSEELFAFHGESSDTTVFATSKQIIQFLEEKEVKYTTVDLTQLEAAAPTTNKEQVKSIIDSSVAKIGIEVKKDEDFAQWYRQVLIKSDMIDYYDVSGCYIYRPWSYDIWRHITAFFDKEITELGVEPAYFPLFVSQTVLEKEKDHIEGFAPEVAWVTRAGQSELEVPVAIRPTSETVMYPYYAKWIQSYRDLPLRLNQWNSVVRWEFKNPQPFIRTREFLWQEGHTAFLTKEEADKEVLEILELYRQIYEDYLAVPIIKGVKSEKEKFAGGNYTTTCEGFIPSTGRGIQGATSHCLGQNFSKMFNIEVEDPTSTGDKGESKKLFVWQNSWGISTRSIGVMVMVHGDDKGLVLPPKVASIQVIVIPCGIKVTSSEKERKDVEEGVNNVVDLLKKAGIRAKADLRDNYTPGYKFNHWELRGVPIRLEIGPMDLAKKSTLSVRRDNGKKESILVDELSTKIPELLNTIHLDMFNKAKKEYDEHVIRVEKWEDFVPALDSKSLVLIPWCEEVECEEDIKDRSAKSSQGDEPVDEKAPSMGAKSLCIPFEQPSEKPIVLGETKCVACQKDAKRFALFGRSY